MNTMDISIGCFFVTFIANLAHWNGRRTEQFVYYPKKRVLITLLAIWSGAAALAFVLWLIRLVSLVLPAVLSLTWMAGVQAYSTWIRWRQRSVRLDGSFTDGNQ
jgi:hypothetical protein